jgi:hypothetical protein
MTFARVSDNRNELPVCFKLRSIPQIAPKGLISESWLSSFNVSGPQKCRKRSNHGIRRAERRTRSARHAVGSTPSGPFTHHPRSGLGASGAKKRGFLHVSGCWGSCTKAGKNHSKTARGHATRKRPQEARTQSNGGVLPHLSPSDGARARASAGEGCNLTPAQQHTHLPNPSQSTQKQANQHV